jgi:hypothetical protein
LRWRLGLIVALKLDRANAQDVSVGKQRGSAQKLAVLVGAIAAVEIGEEISGLLPDNLGVPARYRLVWETDVDGRVASYRGDWLVDYPRGSAKF